MGFGDIVNACSAVPGYVPTARRWRTGHVRAPGLAPHRGAGSLRCHGLRGRRILAQDRHAILENHLKGWHNLFGFLQEQLQAGEGTDRTRRQAITG
jgi:hypothetical protein